MSRKIQFILLFFFSEVLFEALSERMPDPEAKQRLSEVWKQAALCDEIQEKTSNSFSEKFLAMMLGILPLVPLMISGLIIGTSLNNHYAHLSGLVVVYPLYGFWDAFKYVVPIPSLIGALIGWAIGYKKMLTGDEDGFPWVVILTIFVGIVSLSVVMAFFDPNFHMFG